MADNENANVSAGTAKGSEIFDRELLELSHRREDADRPEQDQNEGEIRKNLVGLAFSGGSLRSAAISLGVLQAIKMLIEHKGYTSEQLPHEDTLRQMLDRMGYKMRRVLKAKPKKKIKETDAIFENVHQAALERCVR